MQQTSWQAMASTVFLELSSGRRRHPCSFGSDLCLLAKTGPLPPAHWSSLAAHASGLCAGVRGVPGCGMDHTMRCWCFLVALTMPNTRTLGVLLEQQY